MTAQQPRPPWRATFTLELPVSFPPCMSVRCRGHPALNRNTSRSGYSWPEGSTTLPPTSCSSTRTARCCSIASRRRTRGHSAGGRRRVPPQRLAGDRQPEHRDHRRHHRADGVPSAAGNDELTARCSWGTPLPRTPACNFVTRSRPSKAGPSGTSARASGLAECSMAHAAAAAYESSGVATNSRTDPPDGGPGRWRGGSRPRHAGER